MTLSEAFARGQRESAKSTIYVIFILVGFFFFTTSFAQRQRDFAQSIKGTRWRDSPPIPVFPEAPPNVPRLINLPISRGNLSCSPHQRLKGARLECPHLPGEEDTLPSQVFPVAQTPAL